LLAHDVLAVVDAVGATRFVAVGHSMGGKLAQYLPLLEPDCVQGLVLVASPSAGELATPDFVRGWVQHAGHGQALLDASVMPFLRNAVAEEVLQRFVREAAKIPRTYLERTMDLVSETSFIERLSSVSIPVLSCRVPAIPCIQPSAILSARFRRRASR
jgi:pimeloyl-ACP methyl ester carboxylesterase